MRRRVWTCMVGVSLAAGALVSLPSPAVGQAPDPAEAVLVKFAPGTSGATAAAIHRQNGGTVTGTIDAIGVAVVEVPPGRAAAAARSYANERSVLYAEPDAHASATETPNDPLATKEWALTKVQAPAAWDVTHGSTNVTVAVLDTGVSGSHPDLAGKVVAAKNFTASSTLDDVYGHGTHVAGTAAAATNNGTGIAGVGWNVRILNGKVLGDNGSGAYSGIAQGIVWAADSGARVINLSLGGTIASSTLEGAVNYAWGKGVVVVAAAGNGSVATPFYPAYYSNVIAVAASDEWDRLAPFSNFGTWVDVAAPGTNIHSTLPNDAYGNRSGTSMASPQVAGLAALISGATTGVGVRACIESSADTVGLAIAGGRINALAAVTCAASAPAPTTGAVVGVVTNAATGAPVANASVTAGGASAATNSTGAYTLAGLATGTYTVAANASGYNAASTTSALTAGQTTVANLALQPLDTTAPLVGITSPVGGTTVSGSTSVAVNATDASGIARADLYVDGTLVGSSGTAPYAVSWNTTSVANGSHTLVAKAVDAAGNVGTSASVSVNVANSTTATTTFNGNLGGRNQPKSASHSFSLATAGPMSATMTFNKKATLTFSVYSSAGAVLTTATAITAGKIGANLLLPAGTFKVVVSVLSGASSYTLAVTHT